MTALGSCETIILDWRPFLSPTKGTKSSPFRKSCGRGGGTGDGCLGDRNAEVFRGSIARFSSCYGQDATQEDIYDNDVRPLLDVLYDGVVSLHKIRPVWQNVDCGIYRTQDCDDLCVWRYIFREDSYDARQPHSARYYSPCHARMYHRGFNTVTTMNCCLSRKSCIVLTQIRTRS